MIPCCAPRVRGALWRWRKTLVVIVIVIVILIIAAQIRPPCVWPQLLLDQFPRLTPRDRTDVTVVTAYFNLGDLEKAGSSLNSYKYLIWATVFQYVMNPLVVYTDSHQIADMLKETRGHLANRTQIIRMSRSSLEAFKDVETIRQLFKDPKYPKFHPNTDVAEYPCSQHAKYELVKTTIQRGYFTHTAFIAWIDIGYFRYITRRKKPFYVSTPPGMDESRVAMTQVLRPDWSLSPRDVFLNNLVWVGGGMSLARKPVYAAFVEDYQKATETFLRQGLSSTDQQVIYSMFTPTHNASHAVRSRIQTYSWMFNDACLCWFYLGYLCYREVD